MLFLGVEDFEVEAGEFLDEEEDEWRKNVSNLFVWQQNLLFFLHEDKYWASNVIQNVYYFRIVESYLLCNKFLGSDL